MLDAATDHFARFGYRRTNIADVANDAGVGKGTIYLYFPSKVELLTACLTREKMSLIPQLEATIELQPAERLEAYLQMVIRFALTAPLSSALLKGDREMSAVLADAADAGVPNETARGPAFLADLVADAAPGVSEDERDRLSKVLLMIVALPAHISSMQELMDLSNEEFITTYARVLARGVAIHASDPHRETEPT